MKFKGWIAALSLCVSGAANALSIDLTDWDSAENRSGSYADAYNYEVDGLNLSVMGLSYKDGNVEFERVGQWGGGLGVKNSKNDSHTVDNGGRYDLLLLEFDQEVSIDHVGIGWVGCASYRNNRCTRRADTDISLAFDNGTNIVSAGNIFDAEIGSNEANPGGFFSSTWLIGAFTPLFGAGQDNHWDSFKVDGVSVNVSPVPLPAAFWFLASGLVALGVFRRKAAVK